LIKTPSEIVTERQWTIKQSSSERLCLTLVDVEDEWYLATFENCTTDFVDQLWTLNEFTVSVNGTCLSVE